MNAKRCMDIEVVKDYWSWMPFRRNNVHLIVRQTIFLLLMMSWSECCFLYLNRTLLHTRLVMQIVESSSENKSFLILVNIWLIYWWQRFSFSFALTPYLYTAVIENVFLIQSCISQNYWWPLETVAKINLIWHLAKFQGWRLNQNILSDAGTPLTGERNKQRSFQSSHTIE